MKISPQVHFSYNSHINHIICAVCSQANSVLFMNVFTFMKAIFSLFICKKHSQKFYCR